MFNFTADTDDSKRRDTSNSVAVGSLVNNESFYTPSPRNTKPKTQIRENDKRKKRYKLREAARPFARTPGQYMSALERCGLDTYLPGGEVIVRATDTGNGVVGGYVGVSSCGSVWACPVCSSKICAHRQEELSQVLCGAHGAGRTLAFVTLTIRHNINDSLKYVWQGVSHGWSRGVMRGKAWRTLVERWNVEGYVRSAEVTHGENGWHVHLHTIFSIETPEYVLNSDKDSKAVKGFIEDVHGFGDIIGQRWRDGLHNGDKEGNVWDADFEHGHDVQVIVPQVSVEEVIKLSVYMGKGDEGTQERKEYKKTKLNQDKEVEGLSKETAYGMSKKARNGNRTPFQILESLVETGDFEDLMIWEEWLHGSRGKKQLTWSRDGQLLSDLRKLYGVEEKEDEEIVEEEMGSSLDNVVVLPYKSYLHFRSRLHLPLDAVEKSNEDLYHLLNMEKVHYYVATGAEIDTYAKAKKELCTV